MSQASDVAWKAQGLCRDLGVELFYEGDDGFVDLPAAKAVCAECPVRMECLWSGIVNGEEFGVWGGATRKERRQILNSWIKRGNAPRELPRVPAVPNGSASTKKS